MKNARNFPGFPVGTAEKYKLEGGFLPERRIFAYLDDLGSL